MAASVAKRVAGGDAPAQPSAEDLQSVERLLHRIFSVDDVIYKKVRPLSMGPAQSQHAWEFEVSLHARAESLHGRQPSPTLH